MIVKVNKPDETNVVIGTRESMTQPFASIEEIKEALEKTEHCESCNDCGTISAHANDESCQKLVCNNCPVPIQCEFCFTNENSFFNFLDRLRATAETMELVEKKKITKTFETRQCGHNGCLELATHKLISGRISAFLCDQHAGKYPKE